MINVCENDDVTSQAQQHSHGKQRLKRCVLRQVLTTIPAAFYCYC